MSRIATSFGMLGILALPLAAAAQTPTFTKDIAPIFQNKCEACHRPDSIAPMSLVSFEESRPWARSIQEPRRDAADAALAHRQDASASPSSRTIGRSRDKEIDTIVKWVDAGAPKGDPKDMPAREGWPSEQGWNFAKHVRSERTGPDHQVDAVDAEGRRQRRVVEAGGRHRASPNRAGCARSRSVRAR